MQKDTLSFTRRTTKEIGVAPKPMLGFLLLNAELLNQQSLDQALNRARQVKQPLGRVLVMLGSVSERDLQLALQAQSMISHNELTEDIAVRALNWASKKRIPLIEAVHELDDVRRMYDPKTETNELGELLVAARILDQQTLWVSLKNSREAGLLLGRYLLINRLCPIGWLSAALYAMVLIRDQRLTNDEAVQLLKIVVTRKVSFDDALASLKIVSRGPASKKTKLGDLLTQAGLITETQRIESVERGLISRKLTGQILTDSGLVQQRTLDNALLLQDMMDKGVLAPDKAPDVLRRVHSEGHTIDQVLSEMKLCQNSNATNDDVLKLLIESGLIAVEDISRCLSETGTYSMDPLAAVLFAGLVSKQAHEAALEGLSLIKSNRLTWSDATRALQYCERGRCSLDDALLELGIQQHKLDAPSINIHHNKPGSQAFLLNGSWRQLKEFKALIAVLILIIVMVNVVPMAVPKLTQVYAWSALAVTFIVSTWRFVIAMHHMRLQQEELGRLRINNANRKSAH